MEGYGALRCLCNSCKPSFLVSQFSKYILRFTTLHQLISQDQYKFRAPYLNRYKSSATNQNSSFPAPQLSESTLVRFQPQDRHILRWKHYGPEDASWVKVKDLKADKLIKRYYQRRKVLHQYDESATVDEDQLIGRLSMVSPFFQA